MFGRFSSFFEKSLAKNFYEGFYRDLHSALARDFGTLISIFTLFKRKKEIYAERGIVYAVAFC